MTVEDVKSRVVPVLLRHDVRRASLFGSIVRGEDTENSDIDILVEFKGDKSLLDLVGLKQELEEILGRTVDVVTFGSLHPLLKETILDEQKTLL